MNGLDKILGSEREVTMGIEVEVYLLDKDEIGLWTLNEDRDLLESIYSEFDERVYRDYYRYQLEIRTRPARDPSVIVNELCDLIREVDRAAKERDATIVPVSSLFGGVYCGMHVHFSSPEVQKPIQMTLWGLAMYPFALLINRYTLSSPSSSETWSERLLRSRHIGLWFEVTDPHELTRRFMNGERYHDFALNFNTRDGRHRLKDIVTLEFRLFDTVGMREYIRMIIHALYEIARRIDIGFAVDVSKYFKTEEHQYKALFMQRYATAHNTPLVDVITRITPSALIDYLEVPRPFSYRYDEPWFIHYDLGSMGDSLFTMRWPI